MPTYSYECRDCGAEQEVFCKISEMDDRVPRCCEAPMQRNIHPVAGYVQMPCSYVCPVTRQGVTSWKQRKEIMARKGLIDANDMNTPSELRKYEKRMADSKKLADTTPEEVRNFTI